MTHLNLLPERLRSRLHRRSGVRLLLLSLLLGLIIVFDALVLRSFGVSLEQYVSVAETGMYEPLDAKYAKLHRDAMFTSDVLFSFRSVGGVFGELAAATPDDVRIESLSLAAADGKLAVKGVAASVDAADRFRRALSGMKLSQSVAMPTRDLLNDGEVRFTLEAKVELKRL